MFQKTGPNSAGVADAPCFAPFICSLAPPSFAISLFPKTGVVVIICEIIFDRENRREPVKRSRLFKGLAMETVKLVIWDLDETFWKGTLSDGAVSPLPENIRLVKELTDRGIVNSICSKNDFDKVRAELESARFEAIWDLFVFPSVDWSPKGQRVAAIIKDMNLRPANCLFVDDNISNLNEAKFISPELNVAAPGEFAALIKAEEAAFRGKDDSSRSRLKQYKILETKTAERKRSSSNDEFLRQSEIKVEIIERDPDLKRIHEMIHRNNQLNFTKDRISEDEVKRIFTDPVIKSGEVHVTDKYGDHGIVGCYALKDGKLLQFVFSCRILGMGVEQYVYEKLGWPDITIVGEVASKLNKGEVISWINASGAAGGAAGVKAGDNAKAGKLPGRLLVYGYCPLRPIWAYLEHEFENAVFNLILPMPPVCNLGVMFRTDPAVLNEYLSLTNALNLNTFDSSLLSGKADYLLISFINELEAFKCISRDNPGRFFYSSEADNLPEGWIPERISCNDLYREISFLAERLRNKTRIFILTSPEVVFEIRGRDGDYQNRISSNKTAERLARENDNVSLLDIRKYARHESDFFETMANHYNRAIGYACARDLISQIKGQKTAAEPDSASAAAPEASLPANAITRKIPVKDYDISCAFYIRNSELHFAVNCAGLTGVSFAFRVFCNRYEICRINGRESRFSMNVTNPGVYHVKAEIRRDWKIGNIFRRRRLCAFDSGRINYSAFNYMEYIDPKAPNYDFCINSIDQFWKDNTGDAAIHARFTEQLTELSASGVSVGQYFKERGIARISVFFDDKFVGKALLANLGMSGIAIDRVFSTDSISSVYVQEPSRTYKVCDINHILRLKTARDILLIASVNYMRPYVNRLLKVRKQILGRRLDRIFFRNRERCCFLDYILSVLMTRTFFPKMPDNLVIGVRTGGFFPFSEAMKYQETTLLSERRHLNMSNTQAWQLLRQKNLEPFADYIRNSSIPRLIETLKSPGVTEKDGRQVLKDCRGKYFNVENGFRKTVGAPAEYQGTVYLMGNCLVYGAGAGDDETIASCLQKILPLPYRVVNYANVIWDDWNRALELLAQTKLEKNDIVVFFLPNAILPHEPQLLHWLNYDGLPDNVVKADALPLFLKKDRPVYFALPRAYTPACNQELAVLVKDTIMEHIPKA